MNPSHPRAFLVAWLPILSCSGWLFACAVGVDASLEEELGTQSDGIGVRPVDVTHTPASTVALGEAASPADLAAERPRQQAREANARGWGESKVEWLFGVECGLAGIWPARYNECCHKYPEGWGVGGTGQTKCSEFCQRMFFQPNEIQACNDGCMSEFTRVCQSKNGG